MKCVICHGEQVAPRNVNEEIAVGNDIVRIPITTPVCGNCGERYYDRKTMRFLEQKKESVASERSRLKEIGKVLVYGD